MASAVVKTSKSHGPWQSWNIYGLAALPLANNISLAAGLTGSAISAATILPQYCKIAKVAVAYSSVDLFDGSEMFNIVVEAAGDGTPAGNGAGFGASFTPNITQLQPPSDNSLTYGYPTQFATVGDCVFAIDRAFNVSNFPAGGTGGGSAVFAPAHYDSVYAAGTVLSLRAVTTASTGAVHNLCVVLFTEPLDDYISDDNAVPITNW